MRMKCETQRACFEAAQAMQDGVMTAVAVTLVALVVYVAYHAAVEWKASRGGER